jgi:hypothetical protein
LTGIFLFGAAVVAYALFYYAYVPRIGFERAIHLQFDNVYSTVGNGLALGSIRNPHPYPYGSVSLAPDLVSAQAYDVRIELTMPRTPTNIVTGNFMLEVNMYGPGADNSVPGSNGNIAEALRADITPGKGGSSSLLASSRRHAILPYRSPVVEFLYKATQLHWYLLGLRSESGTLDVPIYESVSFPRGRANIPSTLRLEIQSTHRLQIYSAKVHFRARFKGLRWLLYNHRIISAILFIGLFWITELTFAGIAWAAISVQLAQQGNENSQGVDNAIDAIKEEEDDEDAKQPLLSDTERTFPTLSAQQPLHYASSASKDPSDVITVKREEVDEPLVIPDSMARATEADDEDEEEDDFFDSGIGTSLDSAGPGRSDSMRRRRGRLMSGARRDEKDRF